MHPLLWKLFFAGLFSVPRLLRIMIWSCIFFLPLSYLVCTNKYLLLSPAELREGLVILLIISGTIIMHSSIQSKSEKKQFQGLFFCFETHCNSVTVEELQAVHISHLSEFNLKLYILTNTNCAALGHKNNICEASNSLLFLNCKLETYET